MTATTAQIREAFATTIASALGSTWNVSAYVKAKPGLPAIDVMPGSIAYDRAMNRGLDDATYIVRGLVAFAEEQSAQTLLDGLLDLDPSSLTSMKNAVETKDSHNLPTLGGIVQWVRVTEVSEYKLIPSQDGTQILGVEFTVEVGP